MTLDDISQMIKAGEEVKVIDNKSGEDLTSVTLAQIIFETEKKNSFMPLHLLRGLIQNSGESIGDFAREQVETVQNTAQGIRDTAQDTVTKFTSQITGTVGRVMKADGEEGDLVEGEQPVGSAQSTSVKDMLSNSQKTLDEIQKGLEERIQGGIGTVSENVRGEVEDIVQRIGALKDRFRK